MERGVFSMPYTIGRVTLKSQEQEGAGQPNIVELGFLDGSDISTFGTNLSLCASAGFVSYSSLLSSDYSLPYPVGSDSMTRTAVRSATGHWQQLRIFDTPDGFVPVTRAAALIASGFLLDESGEAPASVNVQVFLPGPSV